MYTSKMKPHIGALYMLSQAAGAIAAGGLLLVIYGTNHPLGA